ncbi:hypothetical protein BH11MYX4_BH11MYX4_06980 [soil metagenome]
MAYGMLKAGVVTLALVGTGVLAGVGCGNDAGGGVANAKLPEGVRSQVIDHEACDESGNKVEMLDANNDGKPDIKKVSKGGREVCRITDLNHDGKPDMFEYYDATGQLRRREADYDDNGVVNSIEHFENGKLVRRELDTTNQGRIDTWDYFDPTSGARIKRERDANGDGKIDQWWTYEGGQVTIAMDRNGDGQPDPDSTITLGANGQVIGDGGVAAADAAPATPSAPGATTPPTLSMPGLNSDPTPPTSAPTTDAGVAGKPARGGAKR